MSAFDVLIGFGLPVIVGAIVLVVGVWLTAIRPISRIERNTEEIPTLARSLSRIEANTNEIPTLARELGRFTTRIDTGIDFLKTFLAPHFQSGGSPQGSSNPDMAGLMRKLQNDELTWDDAVLIQEKIKESLFQRTDLDKTGKMILFAGCLVIIAWSYAKSKEKSGY